MIRNLYSPEVSYYMIPYAGVVGAGASVYQFPQTERRAVKLALPTMPAEQARHLIYYVVSGCSLEGDRICDGDILVGTTDFERTDIMPDDVCIVLLYNSEVIAKHVIFQPDGQIALYSHEKGGGFEKTEVEAEQVQVLAIVTDIIIPRKKRRLK